LMFCTTTSGAVKSTIASASGSSTSSCPASFRAGASTDPTFPPAPKSLTFTPRRAPAARA
jgi:hypothetical protein